MTLRLLLLVLSIIFFCLAATPKVARGWMIAVALALFFATFLPWVGYRLGGG